MNTWFISPSLDVEKTHKSTLNITYKLWEEEYKDLTAVIVSSTIVNRKPDEYDLWEKKQAIIVTHNDEFNRFINGEPIILSKRQILLQWWLEPAQLLAYPSLSWMVIDILSIPAMSERVFSGTRRIISWQRMRLGVKIIEAEEYLKLWIKSGIINCSRRLNLSNLGQQGEAMVVDSDSEVALWRPPKHSPQCQDWW